MKIIVLGSAVRSLETAFYWQQMGAAVSVMQEPGRSLGVIEMAGQKLPLLEPRHLQTVFDAQSLKLLNFSVPQKAMPWQWWLEAFYYPLESYLKENCHFYQAPLERVEKSLLIDDEIPTSKTRLSDLFRAVYWVDPASTVEEQKDERLAGFKSNEIESLKKPLEVAEEADAIFDARELLDGRYLKGNTPAIGERQLHDDRLSYQLTKPSDDWQQVAMVGEGALAAYQLLLLEEWLFAKEPRQLHYISSHHQPLKELHAYHPQLIVFEQRVQQHWQEKHSQFQEQLKAWEQLETYEKVKVKKPVAPQPKLQVHDATTVMAIDRLVDRKPLYLSIEKPAFRKVESWAKTLPFDAVICVNQGQKKNVFSSLLTTQQEGGRYPLEPGFYQFFDLQDWGLDSSSMGQFRQKLKFFSDDLMRFFSKVEQ